MSCHKQTAGHAKYRGNGETRLQSTQKTPRFNGEDVAFLAIPQAGLKTRLYVMD
jgi:hypothetical protein